MLKLALHIVEHPEVLAIGIVIGYIAPSNVSTILSQLLKVGSLVLAWIKSKI